MRELPGRLVRELSRGEREVWCETPVWWERANSSLSPSFIPGSVLGSRLEILRVIVLACQLGETPLYVPPYMDLRCLGMSIIWDDSSPALFAVGWLLGVGCQGNGAGVECYYSPGARLHYMSARHTLHAAPPFYNFGLTKWRAKLCFPLLLK